MIPESRQKSWSECRVEIPNKNSSTFYIGYDGETCKDPLAAVLILSGSTPQAIKPSSRCLSWSKPQSFAASLTCIADHSSKMGCLWTSQRYEWGKVFWVIPVPALPVMTWHWFLLCYLIPDDMPIIVNTSVFPWPQTFYATLAVLPVPLQQHEESAGIHHSPRSILPRQKLAGWSPPLSELVSALRFQIRCATADFCRVCGGGPAPLPCRGFHFQRRGCWAVQRRVQ